MINSGVYFFKYCVNHKTFYPSYRKYLVLGLFLGHVCKAARVTHLGGLPYLHAKVTLAGRLTFFLVNTSGRVNLSTQVNFFNCFQTLRVKLRFKLSRVVGLPYPTRESLLVNPGYLLPSS